MQCYVLGTRTCRCGEFKNFSSTSCHNDHAVLRKFCADQTWLLFQFILCYKKDVIRRSTRARLLQNQMELALELSWRFQFPYLGLKFVLKEWILGILDFVIWQEGKKGVDTAEKKAIHTDVETEKIQPEIQPNDKEKVFEQKTTREGKADAEQRLLEFSSRIGLLFSQCVDLPPPPFIKFFKQYCLLLFRCQGNERDLIFNQDALINHSCFFADLLMAHMFETSPAKKVSEFFES